MTLLGLLLTCLAAASPGGNQSIDNFQHAKLQLVALYAEHRVTIYSGCAFEADKSVDYRRCNYRPQHGSERAHRIEWEHVVPAEAFGQAFVAWRVGDAACVDVRGKAYRGRKCASKVSAEYRHMEADLYNLYPEIGELNLLRSNYGMAEIPGDAGVLTPLRVKIAGGKFEPAPEVKGDIARTYLYMDDAYPGRGIVSRKNRALFEAWSRADPVDAWECKRARRIEAIQGNRNTFVSDACARDEL
jgi:deoxyribonuclease-1